MRVLDKKVGSVFYYKYRVNLPIKIVERSHMLNKELEAKFEKGKIIIQEISRENRQQNKQKLTKREKILQKELLKAFNVKLEYF